MNGLFVQHILKGEVSYLTSYLLSKIVLEIAKKNI